MSSVSEMFIACEKKPFETFTKTVGPCLYLWKPSSYIFCLDSVLENTVATLEAVGLHHYWGHTADRIVVLEGNRKHSGDKQWEHVATLEGSTG